MEKKTKLSVPTDSQVIVITRDFELPVDALFTAFVDADIVAHWMGTNVIQLESKPFGHYVFETTDPTGHVHVFNGTIHELEENKKITRTFQMVGTPFPVQLEYLTFESLSVETSRLVMHVVYKTTDVRDAMLKMPFEAGINMAHQRLENYFKS